MPSHTTAERKKRKKRESFAKQLEREGVIVKIKDKLNNGKSALGLDKPSGKRRGFFTENISELEQLAQAGIFTPPMSRRQRKRAR